MLLAFGRLLEVVLLLFAGRLSELLTDLLEEDLVTPFFNAEEEPVSMLVIGEERFEVDDGNLELFSEVVDLLNDVAFDLVESVSRLVSG